MAVNCPPPLRIMGLILEDYWFSLYKDVVFRPHSRSEVKCFLPYNQGYCLSGEFSGSRWLKWQGRFDVGRLPVLSCPIAIAVIRVERIPPYALTNWVDFFSSPLLNSLPFAGGIPVLGLSCRPLLHQKCSVLASQHKEWECGQELPDHHSPLILP